MLNRSNLTVLNIFNAIKAGAELGLATSLITAASVSFFLEKNFIYLDIERFYTGDFSDTHSSFASAPGVSQTSAEMVQMTKSFSRTSVKCRSDVVMSCVSKN